MPALQSEKPGAMGSFKPGRLHHFDRCRSKRKLWILEGNHEHNIAVIYVILPTAELELNLTVYYLLGEKLFTKR